MGSSDYATDLELLLLFGNDALASLPNAPATKHQAINRHLAGRRGVYLGRSSVGVRISSDPGWRAQMQEATRLPHRLNTPVDDLNHTVQRQIPSSLMT